ncbi:MAG: virulence protein RhuM/Fic/DOC family protein [Ferrovum sp.]|nr:virulence protein RhuM/Fic/DOC family protein [Ferrovum sp.]
MSELILFQDESGKSAVNVRLDGDTVWLTQIQMADIFSTTRQNIEAHIKNIYTDGELDEKATSKEFLLVRTEGSRSVSRNVSHYNLDAIISVGYRVNSKQGVKFRQWATKTLNDHLVHGFTLNQHRIAECGLVEAQQAMDLLARTLSKQDDLSQESRGVLALVAEYAKTWKTLLQYDDDTLPIPAGTPATCSLNYETAINDIGQMKQALASKGEATSLFGQERGEAFQGILGSIDQTMFGEPLYKSAEEKASNLLYFIIKDHPFSDGNKRIASFMFLRYIQEQKIPMKFSPNAMTALALLVAESDPGNKDLMIRLTMNSIVEHPELSLENSNALENLSQPKKIR